MREISISIKGTHTLPDQHLQSYYCTLWSKRELQETLKQAHRITLPHARSKSSFTGEQGHWGVRPFFPISLEEKSKMWVPAFFLYADSFLLQKTVRQKRRVWSEKCLQSKICVLFLSQDFQANISVGIERNISADLRALEKVHCFSLCSSVKHDAT